MSRYILKITGKRLSTFVNLLIKLKLNFEIKKETKDYIIIEITEDDYEKLTKLKTTYNIEILKRKGIIYFKHILKTRKIFIISIILGVVFLTILTNMIFEINVIETDYDIKQIILQDLKELGIKKYKFKVNYQQKEKIEEQILKKEKDILEWIEIEEKGTIYEIKIIKRIKEEIKDNIEERNIIAKKNGMITKIIAEQGEVITKKNTYVNKGDVLISGIIKNKDNIVSKESAKGKVYAEIWYKISLSLPPKYEEKIKTGKNKKILELTFLNNDISLTEFKKYKHSLDTKKTIWKHSILPISINITKKEEVKIKNIDFNKNYEKNIKTLAINKLKEKLGSDIKILSEKVLKKTKTAGKINIDIFFKVEEDITDYESLTDFNIDIENEKLKEENG